MKKYILDGLEIYSHYGPKKSYNVWGFIKETCISVCLVFGALFIVWAIQFFAIAMFS